MLLGLIDRPFVPHNLISAQDSPVPLPKFQMATRLKILMSCGYKEGTQIYYPFLSIKSRQANLLQVAQRGWISTFWGFILCEVTGWRVSVTAENYRMECLCDCRKLQDEESL
jgi:hypothetical protein